jgi:hypothetical protein
MKQILHIFTKDARHLWLEILISLALTAALVLTSPQYWQSGLESFGVSTVSFSPRASLTFLPSLLTAFIPLSWWVLISPLIHDERLVGDRQFWLTRPFEWRKLLAAKTLLLVAFLYVPLLIAQCLVLARAGFNPISGLPGLLFNLLMLSGTLILPLITLAAITRNFARLTLVILGVIICLIAISWLASIFPGTRIATPFGDNLSFVLVIGACVSVIVFQYAARRTMSSWVVLTVTLGVVAILACAAPDQALMNRRYPAVDGQSPDLELSYRNDVSSEPLASVARGPHDVVINIPIHVSGIAAGSLMIPEALRVTLDSPGNSHWTSFWQPIYLDKFLPGERQTLASFAMPRDLYERLKSTPLQMHIVLALQRAHEGGTTTVSLPLTEFQVPGFGTCTPQTGFFEKPYEIGGITCRAALRQPPLTFVRVVWSYDDCHASSEERHNIQGEAWIGSLDRPPAEFAIAPVWSNALGFTNREPDYYSKEPRHMCPGTPATFTMYRAAGRTQASLDIQGFVLPELSRGQLRVIVKPGE